MNREDWLNAATTEMKPWFVAEAAPLPETLRVSCGWPSRGGQSAKKRSIGQCWNPIASADGTTEVFISPVLADAVRVLDVLVHELVHAAVGVDKGHKGPFRKLAKALGLEGKMTETNAGPELTERLNVLAEKLGPYPHASLDAKLGLKKQGTRMLKASCPDCGYTVRLTAKWADYGMPTCVCGGLIELN